MARPSRRPGNLPLEATSFIGRRSELARVRRQFGAARLVTLVGPGGVGKSRVAIRVATELSRTFPDGTWLVELADVRDPSVATNAVLAGMDVRNQGETDPLAFLLAHLATKKLLLILDNCEHLLESTAGLVNEVLRTSAGVRVLATSREPLFVPGEHVVAVPPLDPPAHGSSFVELSRNDAMLLFTERAGAASGFELTAENQEAVAELCRGLDGLPLAIELAAVRTRTLTPEQIRDRLGDRFTLLNGGHRTALSRHQTLRAAIDWSYGLLTETERGVLRRLAIFAGHFTVLDAEAVCRDDSLSQVDIFGELASLVDKSLIMKENANTVATYHLHQTMREYARMALRAAGEEEVMQRRFAEYYASKSRRSAMEARAGLIEWLEWMDLEIDNVRVVIRLCLDEGEIMRGLDLAVSLGWYWITRATAEGAMWLDRLIMAGDAVGVRLPWATFMRGYLAVLQADATAARPVLSRAIDEARASGSASLVSLALSMASVAERMAGNTELGRKRLQDAADIVSRLDDFAASVTFLQAKALNGFFDGDVDVARSAALEGVRISREADALSSIEHMLINLGVASLLDGTIDSARAALHEALEIALQIDDRVGQCYILGTFSYLSVVSGTPDEGARILGAADALRGSTGARFNPAVAPLVARVAPIAREALGAAAFARNYEAGKRLRPGEAIGLALDEMPKAAAMAAAPNDGPLGRRETDVARLVAQGLTNKQIGARLLISDHTVDSHVRSILNKLGASSRSQIAAWMASSTTV